MSISHLFPIGSRIWRDGRRPAFGDRLRRLFLPILFVITLLATQGFAQATSLNIQNAAAIRGVWMTVNDSVIWRDRSNTQKAMADLARLNFNTIYPVVWNSGYTQYPSAVAQQAKIQSFIPVGKQGQDTLADLAAQAHQQGLRVIPWMEFGFMTPPSSELATQHPDWLTQQSNGNPYWVGAAGEVVWLNPFHPEVQQFMSDLVSEVVSRYDVDGIQFDDHTSLPNVFGYDPYTLALYAKETKKTGVPLPSDPHWVSWRANKLTAFMERLNKTVKAIRPNAVFSVAPNPYDTAYKGYLQDWLGWIRKGIVDELIVQIYRPDLNSFFSQATRPELVEAQKKIPTGVGILTGLQNRVISMAQIQTQTQAAQSQGLGVTYFYYESLWDLAPEPMAMRQSQFQALLADGNLQARSR
ncbi:MAG: glycoside hydrolase family 10 protein [Thermosynechococcaceae cyanobacterium]